MMPHFCPIPFAMLSLQGDVFMRKGLVLLINEIGEQKRLSVSAGCEDNGVVAEDRPAHNSGKGDYFSRKQSREAVVKHCPRDIRNKAWSYFLRGRVESMDVR